MIESILAGIEEDGMATVSRAELARFLPAVAGTESTLDQRVEGLATARHWEWKWSVDGGVARFEEHSQGDIPAGLTASLWAGIGADREAMKAAQGEQVDFSAAFAAVVAAGLVTAPYVAALRSINTGDAIYTRVPATADGVVVYKVLKRF